MQIARSFLLGEPDASNVVHLWKIALDRTGRRARLVRVVSSGKPA